MTRPVIYYRPGPDVSEDEIFAMKKNFPCVVTSRMEIQKDDLCIARYSALPFYKELEDDLKHIGASLLNTYRQHRYVADLGNWYRDLQKFTPETWTELEAIPQEGPFILKGETNSKKFYWDTHFFAKNKREAIDVFGRLQDDGLISGQHIYIRRFVELHTYLIGLRGMPVTKEFRIFICDGKVLSMGYYWSNYCEDISVPDTSEVPLEFVQKIIDKVGNNIRFWVLDIAQTAKGDWIVIELNDGNMSGLSMNDPNVLYSNLASVLKNGNCNDNP